MADYRLSFAALPFAYPGGPQQTVTVRVNGRDLPGRLDLAAAWTPYEVKVPAGYLRPGLNEFVLQFGYAISPRQALPADFTIGASSVRSPVEITVQSGSGFAAFKIGDAEVPPAGGGLRPGGAG